MAVILAVQADHEQASLLQVALGDLENVTLLVAQSKDSALVAFDSQVPDLVLLHALMEPKDDDHFVACLRAHPDAAHVPVISIPKLQSSSDAGQRERPLLSRLGRGKEWPLEAGCDPRLFADDVSRYLSRAQALKQEIEWRRESDRSRGLERRRAPRWLSMDVPWLSSVRLPAGEWAELIDFSAGGVLVRCPERPQLASLRDPVVDAGPRPAMTLRLTSGEEVRLVGRVIRCRAESYENETRWYEVAFRFDESIDVSVPTLVERASEPSVHAGATDGSSEQTVRSRSEDLDHWCRW
jgi:CheY-like chemotaxis protein